MRHILAAIYLFIALLCGTSGASAQTPTCSDNFLAIQNLINQDIISGVGGGIKATTVNSLMTIQNSCYLNTTSVNPGSLVALGITPNTTGGIATWPVAPAAPLGLPQVIGNSALALKASTASPLMRMGFYAAGDSPAIIYTASTGACTLNAGAGDGGSQVPTSDGKCWIGSFPDGDVYATQFGADPSGASDSTSAIQKALAYTTSNDYVLKVPCGDYIISGSGTEVFLVTDKRMFIAAPTLGCTFLNTAAVGSATYIFHQVLTANIITSYINNMAIGHPVAGQYGGSTVWRIEATTNAASLINMTMTGDSFWSPESSGPTVYATAPSTTLNGALVSADIGPTNFFLGFRCDYCGDGNIVHNNRIGNPPVGAIPPSVFGGSIPNIEMSFVGGATGFVASQNVMQSRATFATFHNGITPQLIHNEMETVNYFDTSTNHTTIDFSGDLGTIYHPIVFGNNIASSHNIGALSAIRLDHVENADIDGNSIIIWRTDSSHILLTANASSVPYDRPFIGGGNSFVLADPTGPYYGNSFPYISDSSTWGYVLAGGLVSSAEGVVANPGVSATGATPLKGAVNRITTVATTGDSVILPASSYPFNVGISVPSVTVCNAAANSATVFPYTKVLNSISYPDTINGGSSYTLAGATCAVFLNYAPTQWATH